MKVSLAGLAAGAGFAVLAQFGFLPVSGTNAITSAAGGGYEGADAKGGFLSKLMGAVRIAPPPLDYSQFKHGELLKALKDGDLETLNKDESLTLIYLSGFHAEISSPNVLYYASNRDILTVIDPSLTTALDTKIFTSTALNERATQVGMESFLGMLRGVAQTRQAGGSVSDEVSAFKRGMIDTPTKMPVEQWTLEGQKDARVLASKFETNRAEFEQIYGGISKYLAQ